MTTYNEKKRYISITFARELYHHENVNGKVERLEKLDDLPIMKLRRNGTVTCSSSGKASNIGNKGRN